MNANPEIHRRRSLRLKGYDYSRAGAYFVTICTHNQNCLFGNVVDGAMQLNDAGRTVKQCWDAIPSHFPHVELDECAVMPNHVHGVAFIVQNPPALAKDFSPLHMGNRLDGPSKTIGSVVRGFKIGVTKWMRRNTPVHDVWQRNYWEHVVRNESELNRIREYIQNNPAQWEMDRLNPHEGKFFDPAVREPQSTYETEIWKV